MDPPAPVTRTRRPRRKRAIASVSNWTASRPRRSLMSTGRICATTRPSTSSLTPGSTLGLTPVPLHRSVTRRRCFCVAEGMAMMISSIPSFAQMSGMSWVVPRTGTPWMKMPFLVRSSSTRATTSRFCLSSVLWAGPASRCRLAGMRMISRTTASAVFPAPTTRTLRASLSPPDTSWRSRNQSRTVLTRNMVARKSRTNTLPE